MACAMMQGVGVGMTIEGAAGMTSTLIRSALACIVSSVVVPVCLGSSRVAAAVKLGVAALNVRVCSGMM